MPDNRTMSGGPRTAPTYCLKSRCKREPGSQQCARTGSIQGSRFAASGPQSVGQSTETMRRVEKYGYEGENLTNILKTLLQKSIQYCSRN